MFIKDYHIQNKKATEYERKPMKDVKLHKNEMIYLVKTAKCQKNVDKTFYHVVL